MHHRTSIVPSIFINTITFSSIFEIGDARDVNTSSKEVAVQREYPLYLENEADFSLFRIFSETIPRPERDTFIHSDFIQINPLIKVDTLHVSGMSNASVIQIGSAQHVTAEARIKHIRQLLNNS